MDASSGPSPQLSLAIRQEPGEALRLAANFARALERYLLANGGAVSRLQVVGVVRTWVPRWDAEIQPILADALVEGLVRQGHVVATRQYVGLVERVEYWRRRFQRYPQRLTQPANLVAAECDLPLSAVFALRALIRQT
jgi:hypothetical protein